MSTRARKDRRALGVKFERTPKVPTGKYISKQDQQKAKREFLARVDEAIAKVAEELKQEEGAK